MTEKFLKAKHWQLFLLTFGIPIIFQFVMVGTMLANIGSGNVPDVSFMFSYMKFFPIIMIIFMGVFFGWFWSVVTGLQAKIPEDARMNLLRFKIFFFIPLIYIFCFLVLMGGAMGRMMSGASEPDPEVMVGLLTIIVPLHLFSMFCIFHSLYFVAKTFKTAELQRKVTFSDFAGEFFMIWFYPIGIWIIQPKINKMVEESV